MGFFKTSKKRPIKSKSFNKQKNNYIVFDKPNEKQKYPHFRKYLKSRHPAMIVGEHSDAEWDYKKVMHSDKENGRTNDTIYPNPNPLDPMPMRVDRRLRHDNKKNFSKWRYNWKIKK